MMGGERRREEKMSREGETESNLSIFSSPVVVFWKRFMTGSVNRWASQIAAR